MILFSENITNRLQFVCTFIGIEIFNEPIIITSDRSIFLSSDEPKINYSRSTLTAHEFRIIPHSILFETAVTAQRIDCKVVNGNKAFFLNDEGDYPFDLLAA